MPFTLTTNPNFVDGTGRPMSLSGTIGADAVHLLNSPGLQYGVARYDIDDAALAPSLFSQVNVGHGDPAKLNILGYTASGHSNAGGTAQVYIYPERTVAQSVFAQNDVSNQVKTIIHETLHLSGALNSRRDQILDELAAHGTHITQGLAAAIDELLTQQATRQIDIASSAFRADHYNDTIEGILETEYYGKGIVRVRDPVTGVVGITNVWAAITDAQRAALLDLFNSPTYQTPIVFVNGQFWANGHIIDVPPSATSIPEYTIGQFPMVETSRSELFVVDHYDNGGIAIYKNQNGDLVTVAENTRYTENMLNNYGTEWVNSDGVLEGGMTLGATLQAFGDLIGLDGTFGLDGGFPHDDEGSAAAGNGAGGAGGEMPGSANDNDDDNGGSKPPQVPYTNPTLKTKPSGNPIDPDKAKPLKDLNPILLDLDGNGIQITDLTRSTVFMEGVEGLEHRTAWASAGDGVLFYDTDGDNAISDIREYVFTEWDPTAKDDLAALRSRFDTNGDGKLTGTELK